MCRLRLLFGCGSAGRLETAGECAGNVFARVGSRLIPNFAFTFGTASRFNRCFAGGRRIKRLCRPLIAASFAETQAGWFIE